MPVDPITAARGAEWQIGGLTETQPAPQPGGFGDMLSQSLGSLAKTQNEAAEAAQALATGAAEDPTAVVMAVERAQLAMQLASQIRTKAVEAAQDIFHTQV
jgi:flagellar hook-basal body complex protein FliE